MKYASGFSPATLLAFFLLLAAGTVHAQEQARRDTLLTPADDASTVFAKLIQGNERYVSGQKLAPDRGMDARSQTAVSQRPKAIILSCADSRVAPEVLFDQGVGDLFVVRIAGNTLTQYGLASMEYAVAVLDSPLIVVLGHENCGAVDAAMKSYEDNASFPGEIDHLVDLIEPAVAIASAKQTPVDLHDAVEANVELVVDQLCVSGTVLTRAHAEGKLGIVGGIYNLATGKVEFVKFAGVDVPAPQH